VSLLYRETRFGVEEEGEDSSVMAAEMEDRPFLC